MDRGGDLDLATKVADPDLDLATKVADPDPEALRGGQVRKLAFLTLIISLTINFLKIYFDSKQFFLILYRISNMEK